MPNKYANLYILIGTMLGLITGISGINALHSGATVVAELFMNALKLISLPVIFLSITSTITSMKNWQEIQSLGRKILKYTITTTVIAATVALILFIIINPVHGVLSGKSVVNHATQQGSYLSFFMKIIPANFAQAFLENNVIGIAFVAFLAGIATLHLPQDNKTTLNQLFSSLFALLLKITSYLILLMPIGIWAFMTLLVHDLSGEWSQFKPILLYVCVVLLANLIQGLVVLPALLKFRGLNPTRIFKGVFKALVMAFATKSSTATLPITIATTTNNLKVSPKTANTSLPLCSVINMNGCAAFILVTVLFVAMSNGVAFSWPELVMWIALASIAAIGNAGVPMGCYFLTSAFLVGMGMPLYIMGLILPIYAVIDMVETALNVWSDITVTTIVDKELTENSAATVNKPVTNTLDSELS